MDANPPQFISNHLKLLVRTPGQTWRRSCVLRPSRRADAEDVTQDALLLAHRYRESFRGDSRYSTWLYRVTATAALMFLRRQRRLAREVASSTATDEDGA